MAESMRPVDPADVAEIEVLGKPEPGEADFEVSLESLNQWQLAWRRFRRHKMAVLGTVVLVVVTIIAIIAPILWPYHVTDIPGAKTYGGDPPSVNPISHLFGTDLAGRSVLQQVLVGSRISVAIGIFTMIIATTIGVFVGAIAGYFGGRTDGILMRIVDLLLAIPFLFVILVAARFFGSGDPLSLILIFGLLSWAGMARLTRAMFLSLREMEYVLAARAAGVGDLRTAFRHILPNTLGPIVVSATLILASAIVLEAFVSYLNFGIRATDVSWGNALSNSQGYLLNGNWWWPFFPGMAIAITVIAVNFMGDGLRDALDPRAKDLG